MSRSLLLIIVFCLSSLSSFAQKKRGKEDEPVKEFREDLNSFRPKFEIIEEKKAEVKVPELVVPKNDINKFLKDKLDSVYFYNKIICCADGFRVLIYVGGSSEESRTKRNEVYDVLPLEKSYTDYKAPTFKVKVGDYIDKLEAYYAYARLVIIFPNAIVIPDKVNIVRE